MSAADIAIAALVLIGAFSGYREGFLMSLFSMAAIILGVLGGFKLMGQAMVYLDRQFDINENVLPYVAFGVVFIAILIGVNLLGRFLRLSIDKTFLGRVDQAAGAALGIIKAAFMISVVLWIADALDLEPPDRWTSDSWLLPRVENFAPTVAMWLGDFIPFFKDALT